MAEAVTLEVQTRDPEKNKGVGSRVARRLRKQGRVPAIVYGHKQAPTPISLARDDVWAMIKHSTHLAQLKLGDSTEMVLVRDVQWDHLGKEIIHLDFARVSAEESIETEVRLDFRGTPPGASEGGVVEQLVHTLSVTCRANAIPDVVRVDLSNLHLGQAIHVRDLAMPEGVKANADPDVLLVHVVAPRTSAEPEAGVAAAATVEPEVIGRKAEDKEKED